MFISILYNYGYDFFFGDTLTLTNWDCCVSRNDFVPCEIPNDLQTSFFNVYKIFFARSQAKFD